MPINGVADKFLWKLRLKLNTPDGGLNQSFHLGDKTLADAKAQSLLIGATFRALMPSTCEIKRATISKSNTKKDSKIIKDLIGDGLYGQSGVDPDPTTYNRFNDCVKVRFECDDGGGITYELGPVPDTIIGGGSILLPIDSVEDFAPDPAALGAQPVVYATAFKRLIHLIGKYCCRVEAATNIPGGAYVIFPFTTAHVLGVGEKKGGRVFVK